MGDDDKPAFIKLSDAIDVEISNVRPAADTPLLDAESIRDLKVKDSESVGTEPTLKPWYKRAIGIIVIYVVCPLTVLGIAKYLDWP